MSKIPVNEAWKDQNGNYICPYCSKPYSKFGISSHIWRSHTDIGHNHPCGYGLHSKRHGVWNKGLTKDIDERVRKSAETYVNHLTDGTITHGWLGRCHKPETILMMKRTCGGYNPGSGRGKKGWYKGYWCDSTWELAFVIYMLDLGIKFIRNTEKFRYTYSDEEHHYVPDFLLDCGVYIEVKGYLTAQDLAKHSQFPHSLRIITGSDIRYILKYVQDQYRNLESLYDNASG